MTCCNISFRYMKQGYFKKNKEANSVGINQFKKIILTIQNTKEIIYLFIFLNFELSRRLCTMAALDWLANRLSCFYNYPENSQLLRIPFHFYLSCKDGEISVNTNSNSSITCGLWIQRQHVILVIHNKLKTLRKYWLRFWFGKKFCVFSKTLFKIGVK